MLGPLFIDLLRERVNTTVVLSHVHAGGGSGDEEGVAWACMTDTGLQMDGTSRSQSDWARCSPRKQGFVNESGPPKPVHFPEVAESRQIAGALLGQLAVVLNMLQHVCASKAPAAAVEKQISHRDSDRRLLRLNPKPLNPKP